MLCLVTFASLYLIKRYFFAYEDARTPFLVQIPIAAITLLSVPVILNLVDPQWAAMAAAGSTSFGNLVAWRSEEHTSELQSRGHLVCRLLLEKKNTQPTSASA